MGRKTTNKSDILQNSYLVKHSSVFQHLMTGSPENHWLKPDTFLDCINTQTLVQIQKFLIAIPEATYRFWDSANQTCHTGTNTLRSWCNSSMASASALVAGSSDEPIRLMVSATQRSSSCRCAWNLWSVYAAARASLRRRASSCNERQFSCSSDSLLRIVAERSGCFCVRRRASPSCSYSNQIKCMQYNKSVQIYELESQFIIMNHIPICFQLPTSTFMPVVLHECETWSVTLTENRLRLVGYRVLKKIFRPKREEVTKDWTKLHTELHEL